MFGAATSTANSGVNTGLFGNKAASGNNGFTFGQSSTQSSTGGGGVGGGLFGSGQQQSKPVGGLFGQNNQQSGGLFGGSQQAGKPSGGLFGQQTQQQGSSTSGAGGLFGSSTNQGIGSSGGLFGNTQNGAKPSGGGLFGAKPADTSTFSFGQQQQQQQQQPGSSIFSSTVPVTSTQPSFSWSNNQQQQQQQQQQSSLNTIQLPEQQLQIQQQQQQQQISNYPQQIQEQLLKCRESWVPTEARSKFRAFVYNKCTETEAMLYNKPPTILQEDWDQALASKPSNNTVPIQLLGMHDISDRNQLQKQHVAQARVLLGQILEKLTQVNTKHDLDTQSRISKAISRNVVIENRILKLAAQLAILKNKNLPLSLHEEEMLSNFDKLLQKSNDPAGLGKNNELWARLSVLKERAKNISEQLDSTLIMINENGGTPSDEIVSQDDELENRVNKIAEILGNQQRGLCFLNEVLEKDQKLVDELASK